MEPLDAAAVRRGHGKARRSCDAHLLRGQRGSGEMYESLGTSTSSAPGLLIVVGPAGRSKPRSFVQRPRWGARAHEDLGSCEDLDAQCFNALSLSLSLSLSQPTTRLLDLEATAARVWLPCAR